MTERETEQRELADLLGAGEVEEEDRLVSLATIDLPPTPLDRGLMRSLEQRGQLVPVLLNSAGGSGPKYRVIDGRRRLRALVELGETEALARIHKADDLLASALAVTANAVRSANPENELEMIEHLAEEGFTERQIAEATGLSVQTIRKRKRLLVLPEPVRRGIVEGTVKVGVAEQVARLTPTQRLEAADILAASGTLTASHVDGLTRAGRREVMAELDDLFTDPVPEVPLEGLDTYQLAYQNMLAIFGTVSVTEWRKLAQEVEKGNPVAERPGKPGRPRKERMAHGNANGDHGPGADVRPEAGQAGGS